MDSRLTSALVLYAFLVLGVFLLVAPWTPLWQEVSMLLLPIGWAERFRSGWVRGVASALGALDLLVALQLVGELWKRLRGNDRSGDRVGEKKSGSREAAAKGASGFALRPTRRGGNEEDP